MGRLGGSGPLVTLKSSLCSGAENCWEVSLSMVRPLGRLFDDPSSGMSLVVNRVRTWR